MNDERMQPLLDAWFHDRDEAARDASGDIARVMADVPRTRQQGRWWPLPTFDRPVSTFPSRERAPVPIPATNGHTPAKGFTMFSAVKFVVAGVIVALFGGFLLAGILTTQQGDELVPAAVSASPTAETDRDQPAQTPDPQPSPMTTAELLPGMVTEVVEPGVWRVIGDGVRKLSPDPRWGVVPGDDGGIWLKRDKAFVRLGDEEQLVLPFHRSKHGSSHAQDVTVAPDGTIWAITELLDSERGLLRSYDGEQWTLRSPKRRVDVANVEVGPDGTVWASWTKTGQKGKTFVGTVGPDGLQRVAVVEGEPGLDGLAITHDGDPMLKLDWPYRGEGPMHASRNVDGSWQEVTVDGVGMTALGPDGSVWMLPAQEPPHFDDSGNEYWEATPLDTLLRFDGEVRQEWGPDDGMPTFASRYRVRGDMQVAPDGSLWVSYPLLSPVALGTGTGETYHDGIARFDGQTWRHYLRGYLVDATAIAADGSVWLHAGIPDEGEPYPDTYGLYVIRPDAAVTGE